jgi:hypothetical protein
LNLKAKVESSLTYFSLKALSDRRFQLGFDRVNVHWPTGLAPLLLRGAAPAPLPGRDGGCGTFSPPPPAPPPPLPGRGGNGINDGLL